MKLDVNVLRYLSKEDFRVLTAVEMGQKNHEIVPAALVDSIAGLKHGGAFKCLKHLLKHKLVHHDNSKYDGYRLTYLGYDYLAIKALVNRGVIAGVGRQIGVGKESDIFEVVGEGGEVYALKLHRLGRTSFRAVKSKRDYLRKGRHFSWLYLSRLGALKEFAFMKALGERGLPVPQAIDCNRHAVVMSLVHAHPLVQVRELQDPRGVYSQLMELLSGLAGLGLIHCDFNEFNLLIDDDENLTLIDFPQMVSVSHPNAQELFERDVECIVRFFSKKLGYVPERDEELEVIRPCFAEAVASGGQAGGLDVELEASGFKKHHQEALDRFITAREEESEGESDSTEESDSEQESDSDAEAREAGASVPGGEGRCGSAAMPAGNASGEAPAGGREPAREAEAARESSGDEGDSGSSCGASAGASSEGNDGRSSKGDEGEAVPAAEAPPGWARRRDASGAAGRLAGDLASVTVSVADPRAVQARVTEQQRKAARRAAMVRASRNATKSKNKGKRKGESNVGGGGLGGGGIWG